MPHESCQFAEQAGGAVEEQRRTNQMEIYRSRVGNRGHERALIPGDHLFLLVGGVTAAAQVLIGRRQEVEGVILEVLVDEREKNLRRVKKRKES